MIRISAADEEKFIVGILRQLGVPSRDATSQARVLVEGDLRGHSSHGLQRLPIIVERLRAGFAACEPNVSMDWMSASVLRVDGDRGLGPVVGFAAVDELTARAPAAGAVVAAIHNTNHLGMLAPYVERMADRSFIGIGLTTSEPLVHPWGGRDAMIGTNPIAIAVPTTAGPAVLDMATGAISAGAVRTAALLGEQLQPGCVVDRDGSPTTDPSAAIEGAISPFGGAKGYGLGVMFELLVGALTGTALGQAVTGTLDSETVCNKGDLFMCLDPQVFGGGSQAQLGAFLDELRSAVPSPGSSGVSVPGDGARSRRARSLSVGVDVSDATWTKVRAIARDLGVSDDMEKV